MQKIFDITDGCIKTSLDNKILSVLTRDFMNNQTIHNLVTNDKKFYDIPSNAIAIRCGAMYAENKLEMEIVIDDKGVFYYIFRSLPK